MILAWMWVACTSPGPSGTVRQGPPSEPVETSAPAGDTAPDTVDSAIVEDTSPGDTVDTAIVDTSPPPPCAADAVLVGTVCMDRYEAPNREGALPLVMFTYDEAASWCGARGKRLCTDVEWLAACEGPSATAYPYGDAHEPGRCNDEEVWRVYSQDALSAWPWGVDLDGVEDLDALYAAITGAGGAVAVAEVQELYQGEAAGSNTGCGGAYGVYDLTGNVEEWTARADGGEPSFHGNLKGRYWAESRTCQSNITTHGDSFRFYEIGFRCCAEPAG